MLYTVFRIFFHSFHILRTRVFPLYSLVYSCKWEKFNCHITENCVHLQVRRVQLSHYLKLCTLASEKSSTVTLLKIVYTCMWEKFNFHITENYVKMQMRKISMSHCWKLFTVAREKSWTVALGKMMCKWEKFNWYTMY
jgi:hypothetical protein